MRVKGMASMENGGCNGLFKVYFKLVWLKGMAAQASLFVRTVILDIS